MVINYFKLIKRVYKFEPSFFLKIFSNKSFTSINSQFYTDIKELNNSEYLFFILKNSC